MGALFRAANQTFKILKLPDKFLTDALEALILLVARVLFWAPTAY